MERERLNLGKRIEAAKGRNKNLDMTAKKVSTELYATDVAVRTAEINQDALRVNQQVVRAKATLNKLNKKLGALKEVLDCADYGLYPSVYNFDDSEQLKSTVETCRKKQMKLIQANAAVDSLSNWTWYGDREKGDRMVADYSYLVLRSFNTEFDAIRKQMKAHTYTTAETKVFRVVEALHKMGATVQTRLSDAYIHLKLEELKIWHKDLEHRRDLKKKAADERRILKEQRSADGSIHVYDEDLEPENALEINEIELALAREKAAALVGRERASLELRIAKIIAEIKMLKERHTRAMSQAQLTRAGYIYVISNIGSFGEGVLKIGMTRRLEPMERVRELGDASVPYRFDVHALVFVDDAPFVERTLHKKFSHQRVNKENHRKEFFRVDVRTVKVAFEELGIETDWYFDIEAREYRESEQRRKMAKTGQEASSRLSDEFPSEV